MTKVQRRPAVSVRTAAVVEPSARSQFAETPLFGVAMLKIALELKKPNAAGLDDILSGVLRRMSLSEDHFRAYLEKNGGLLRALASKRPTAVPAQDK